jgi:hypothetical protein
MGIPMKNFGMFAVAGLLVGLGFVAVAEGTCSKDSATSGSCSKMSASCDMSKCDSKDKVAKAEGSCEAKCTLSSADSATTGSGTKYIVASADLATTGSATK